MRPETDRYSHTGEFDQRSQPSDALIDLQYCLCVHTVTLLPPGFMLCAGCPSSVIFEAKVSDAGLASLADLPAALQHLSLKVWKTSVSDAGLAHLAQLPASLQHLELNLHCTQVAESQPWSGAEWAVARRFDYPRGTVLVLLLG